MSSSSRCGARLRREAGAQATAHEQVAPDPAARTLPVRPVTRPAYAPTERRHWLRAGCAAGVAAALAHAGLALAQEASPPKRAPGELLTEWPAPRLQGEGRMRFLGLHVYDIRLWTPEPRLAAEDWPRKPLALEIEYARTLVGRLIAERSLQEMKRAGPLDEAAGQRWLEAMTRLFPDVKAGDRLVGLHHPDGVARFFANGTLRGEVRDAEFARRFFAIWLGTQTSEPGLRDSLLGRR